MSKGEHEPAQTKAEGETITPAQVPVPPVEQDGASDRQRVFCALAAAELAELTWDAMQECQRQGVDLPPGFVGQFAEKLARRAVSSGLFGRLGWRVYRLGVDRGMEVAGEGWKAP